MPGMNVGGDPYRQKLYQDIIGPTAADPARQAYLLRQAGFTGGGGIVQPGWTPPTQPKSPSSTSAGAPFQQGMNFDPTTGSFSQKTTGQPTFAPPDTKLNPANSISSQSDPKIQALLQQLTQQASLSPVSNNSEQIDALKKQLAEAQSSLGATTSQLGELGAPINIARPDSSATDAQAAKLQTLLQQLMRGEGITVGPANQDPQAQAFRVAKLREAERARESEAARLGASGGISGSGDFDSRVAQINEAAGSDISNFEADLTGKLRTAATQNAVTGAQLGLSDIESQRQNQQRQFENDVNLEQARRSGLLNAAQTSAATGATRINSLESLLNALMGQDAAAQQAGTQNRESLLAQLLGEQGRVQGASSANTFASQQAATQAQQLQMEQERQRQQTQDWLRSRSAGNRGGGMVLGRNSFPTTNAR